MRTWMAVIAALALGVVGGCGVRQAELDAKALEADNYRRQYEDESGRAKDMGAKLAALTAELEAQRAAKEALEEQAAQAEARVQELQGRVTELAALNASLAQSTEKLEKAKAELEKKSSQYEALAKGLKDEIRSGKIELSELRGRTVVKLKDKILFSSGSAKVNPEGVAALGKVAQALKDVQGKIVRVEGHTDNVPTDAKGPFPSNWELSTTRALEVVKLLQENGIPGERLSAVGYGEYHPIASNKSAGGKSLNRRIEIVLSPEEQAPGARPARAASR
jgi:chemotaxis protein MotB